MHAFFPPVASFCVFAQKSNPKDMRALRTNGIACSVLRHLLLITISGAEPLVRFAMRGHSEQKACAKQGKGRNEMRDKCVRRHKLCRVQWKIELEMDSFAASWLSGIRSMTNFLPQNSEHKNRLRIFNESTDATSARLRRASQYGITVCCHCECECDESQSVCMCVQSALPSVSCRFECI